MSIEPMRISSATGMELGSRLTGSKTMSAKNRNQVRNSETIEDALETGDRESSGSTLVHGDIEQQAINDANDAERNDATGSILDIEA